MPKKKTNKSLNKGGFSPKKKDIAGIFIFTASAVILFSLIVPNPETYLGSLGGALSETLDFLFGKISFIIPFFGFWWAINEFRHKKLAITWQWVGGFVLFVVSTCTLLHLVTSVVGEGKGGEIGYFLAEGILEKPIGPAGAYIFSLSILIVSLILLTDKSLKEALDALSSFFSRLVAAAKDFYAEINKERPNRPEIRVTSHQSKDKKRPTQKKDKPLGLVKKDSKDKDKTSKVDSDSKTKKPLSADEKTSTEDSETQPKEYLIPTRFLKDSENIKISTDEEEARGDAIIEVLKNFNIESEISGIQIGPSITRYEINLPNPVQLSKIRNLSANIAMATQAKTVRLLTPIPGKSAVGVELPAISQETVPLKSLISSEEFAASKTSIPYCLGKAVSGELKIADLASMPHLLLAGATGSGKSVAIHALIVSILYKSSPSQVNFIMIDPKRVELSVYKGIPHLISEVITNSADAVKALVDTASKMDERYDLLAAENVASIDEYNKIEGIEKMPRMIVVIDELADLMVMARDRVENAIIRIAQMARAVGIHLVLATQRPSVDVITGIIKANLPARIAFNVLSGVDSRTILDSNGAEKLLGKGDMLFLSSELPQPDRIQGCFVGRDEVKRVTAYLLANFGDMKTKEKLNIEDETTLGLGQDSDRDEYYVEAVKLVIKYDRASISFLQRRFRIGYNRAARIIDMMEENGIVGEGDGGVRARKVLVGKDYLDKL